MCSADSATGRTKIIQPLESGVVHVIRVQDGQHVKAGEVLIEIDTTVSASEGDRFGAQGQFPVVHIATGRIGFA